MKIPLILLAVVLATPTPYPCDDWALILHQKCVLPPQHCVGAAQCWRLRPAYCVHVPGHAGCPRKPRDLYVPTPPPTPTPAPPEGR